MRTPYLYRWTEISTNKWYIGSRTGKNCHPDDGYICSSKFVKNLVTSNPSNWKREILCIGDMDYIRHLEANYCKLLDAKNDPNSYNLHNGDGKFTTAGKHSPKPFGFGDKIRQHMLGRKRPSVSQKLKVFMLGNTKRLGKTHSEISKQKMSETIKKNNKFQCPNCDRVIGGKSNLHKHIRIKHG